MPKKPPPIHTRWKKGQSGNPLGAKLQDPELKLIKRLTKDELIEVGNLIIKGNLKSLKALKDNNEISVLKAMLAAVAVRVMSSGDMHALDVLLNRLVGKVKDEVFHSGSAPLSAPQVIITIPSNGREVKKPNE